MNAYVLINFLVIVFPLVLSFDRRVVFFRQWRAVFPAILLVAAFYLTEDILATANGTWAFAEQWSGTQTLLGLPAGEWLFFLTVPYACIFIYACIRSYIRERNFRFPKLLMWGMACAAAAGAIWFRQQSYTFIVLIVFSVTWMFMALFRPDLPGSRQFWTALGTSYLMFLIVNGILTGVPVVTYSPSAIWGFRIGPIPLEDFFYNFCLLSLNFLFFRIFLDGSLLSFPSPGNGTYSGPGGLGSVFRPVRAFRWMGGNKGLKK